jgi:hypothetical protein
MLGMLAPKPLRMVNSTAEEPWKKVRAIYTSANAVAELSIADQAEKK